MWKALLALACLSSLLGTAHAEEPIATYAIVVGSNTGGPGQTDLRYAEDDARKVGALLVELGGYKSDQVDVVVHPTPEQLRAHINALADKLNADLAAGRPSRVFFYYSGHARATALDLGSDELLLVELRQRLFQLPAKLTVVVLDACQSGAFSRVKGAQPAADFSFNSRQQLDATGVAVLASSSGSELSQESEQLKGSYFTHHLLVGMRGASDTNKDGLVTVDEAYRYAYNQTLLATAETAVGGQHVSFEADLKGHGEVPLSYPRAATSSIELPATLEGKTLVEDKRAHSVVAETYKAKGAAVRIAVAPGDYTVMVRQGTTLSRCEVSGGGVVDLGKCSKEELVTTTTKGGGFTRPYRVEIQLVLGAERKDGYTDTLEAFGYKAKFLGATTGLYVSGLRRLTKYFWVGGIVSDEATDEWTRDTDGLYPLRFKWAMTTLAAAGRAETAFAEDGFFSTIKVYSQLGLGLGIGRTTLHDQDDMTTKDSYLGPALSLGAGFLFGGDDHNYILKGTAFSLGYQFEYAPVIENLIGDTHAVGGHRLSAALSYSF
ncbi:MAG TPA: caspase family protein [Kofleriaceae bacterium]|nr:caspase family protein [Kofleriaceae bacterium]